MQLKKSLGQHFLTDKGIIGRITESLMNHSFARLLEVGPGGGALTGELLKIPGIEFKAVELDEGKADYLEKNVEGARGHIIRGNFLQISCPFDEPFTVIGNFPYNISTEILFRVLEWKDLVPVVIGMFQKEVAMRVAAPSGSKVYGVTSALIQPFYAIEYLFDVPPSCFQPPPRVMSGVIRMVRKEEPLAVRSQKDYVLLVKTAFGQRRKMLRNAVKSLFPEEVLRDSLFEKRAEQLGINDFARLTFLMQ